MKLKVVIDTNIWIRILLAGQKTLPILKYWIENKFNLVISDLLINELDEVWKRPRLRKNILEIDQVNATMTVDNNKRNFLKITALTPFLPIGSKFQEEPEKI